ncbi:MAG: glycosyltransferase family 39 protein [Anaerolineales bacterium]|nr:glycosyltransferase family 39 protein [Anaerolineales bacterium]
MRNKVSHILLLFMFLLISITVRLIGIKVGLPFYSHIDEWTKVEPAVHMVADGTLNPGWLGHPGSTLIYPLAGIYKVWFTIAHGGKFFTPEPRLKEFLLKSGPPLFLIARLVVSAYSVLLVPLVYALAKKLVPRGSDWIPLLAAGIIAIEPTNVDWSHVARTDTSVTFFVTLALLAALMIYERPTFLRVIVGGMICGLAVSSKYSAAPVGFTLPVAIYLARRKGAKVNLDRWLKLSFVAVVFTVLGFALSTPYFFFDSELARNALLTEGRSTHLGGDGLSFLGNLWFYLSVAYPGGMTWPLFIASILGLGMLIRCHLSRILIPLTFVFTYLVAICLHSLHWNRWIVPTIPVLLVGAAFFIALSSQWLFRWMESRKLCYRIFSERVCLLSLGVLVLIFPVVQTIHHDIKYANKTTRIVAMEWIETHIPSGSSFAAETYSASISEQDYSITYFFTLSDQDIPEYQAQGYDYLMISSAIYERFYNEPERYKPAVDFYNELEREFPLVKEISPSGWWQTGPVIRIYANKVEL